MSTPADDSVWEIAQGVGSVLAVAVALAALIITIRNARKDRDAADEQVKAERDAGDARLRRQLDDQRERERRRFLVEQLQHVGDLYGRSIATGSTDERQIAIQGLLLGLRAIPSPYASLAKAKMNVPLTDGDLDELERRLKELRIAGVPAITNMMIFDELAENIGDLLMGAGHSRVEEQR